MTPTAPIAPHLDALETELRAHVSDGISSVRTGAAAWRAVMGYAARPIGSEPGRYPDSDILTFSVGTVPQTNEKLVSFERRVGLQEPGWGYIGTIKAYVVFAVIARPAWGSVPDGFAVEYVETIASEAPKGFARFRGDVERSLAFEAFSESEITGVRVSASDV